jgi:hypothetical protein
MSSGNVVRRTSFEFLSGRGRPASGTVKL